MFLQEAANNRSFYLRRSPRFGEGKAGRRIPPGPCSCYLSVFCATAVYLHPDDFACYFYHLSLPKETSIFVLFAFLGLVI